MTSLFLFLSKKQACAQAWVIKLQEKGFKMNVDEKTIKEGPECALGGNHDFAGETVCMLCGISYSELYCDAYNGEER